MATAARNGAPAGAAENEPAERVKGYLVVSVCEASGKNKDDIVVWDPTFVEGFVKGAFFCRSSSFFLEGAMRCRCGACRAPPFPAAFGCHTTRRPPAIARLGPGGSERGGERAWMGRTFAHAARFSVFVRAAPSAPPTLSSPIPAFSP